MSATATTTRPTATEASDPEREGLLAKLEAAREEAQRIEAEEYKAEEEQALLESRLAKVKRQVPEAEADAYLSPEGKAAQDLQELKSKRIGLERKLEALAGVRQTLAVRSAEARRAVDFARRAVYALDGARSRATLAKDADDAVSRARETLAAMVLESRKLKADFAALENVASAFPGGKKNHPPLLELALEMARQASILAHEVLQVSLPSHNIPGQVEFMGRVQQFWFRLRSYPEAPWLQEEVAALEAAE